MNVEDRGIYELVDVCDQIKNKNRLPRNIVIGGLIVVVCVWGYNQCTTNISAEEQESHVETETVLELTVQSEIDDVSASDIVEYSDTAVDASDITVDDSDDIPEDGLEYGHIDGIVYDEKYTHYVDDEFNFYCAIPISYNISDTIGGANRIVAADDNSQTILFVGATENSLNLSAFELMNQYSAEFGNVVDFSAYGDTWYAVSKTQSDTYYYRKCFIQDNVILWFEFNVI